VEEWVKNYKSKALTDLAGGADMEEEADEVEEAKETDQSALSRLSSTLKSPYDLESFRKFMNGLIEYFIKPSASSST
jgi:hypothetical protein